MSSSSGVLKTALDLRRSQRIEVTNKDTEWWCWSEPRCPLTCFPWCRRSGGTSPLFPRSFWTTQIWSRGLSRSIRSSVRWRHHRQHPRLSPSCLKPTVAGVTAGNDQLMSHEPVFVLPGLVTAETGSVTSEVFPTPALFWARTRNTYVSASFTFLICAMKAKQSDYLWISQRRGSLMTADLDECLVRSLVVDSSPRLLGCVCLLDVDVEPVDWIAALVHRWFPCQYQRVAPHLCYLQVMRRSCSPKQTHWSLKHCWQVSLITFYYHSTIFTNLFRINTEKVKNGDVLLPWIWQCSSVKGEDVNI